MKLSAPRLRILFGSVLSLGLASAVALHFLTRLPEENSFPQWSTSRENNPLPILRLYSLNADEETALRKDFEEFSPDLKNLNGVQLVYGILRWASSRFEHDGSNDPGTLDLVRLLQRAHNGERFRCVEYGFLTVAAATALGLPARVLRLQRRDVEIAKNDAGHVAAEIWLPDMNRWLFIDAQWGVIPLLDNSPISATGFTVALKERNPRLSFYTAKNSVVSLAYPAWISPYLYFIGYDADQRVASTDRTYDRVVLTPNGIPAPRFFQGQPVPGNVFATSDPRQFNDNPIASTR